MVNMSDCKKCEWHNPSRGLQDGSVGADKAQHDAWAHPDHTHTWTPEAPEGYEWAMREFYADRGYVWCSVCKHMSDAYTVSRL